MSPLGKALRERGKPPVKYTPTNVGCYADGANGHDHARRVLVTLLAECGVISNERIELIEALRAPMSDDASEEYEVLDILNAELCDGVFFDFVGGDLLLLREGDGE